MKSEELKNVFDHMAPGYDKQWMRSRPIPEGFIKNLAALAGKA